MRALLTCLLWCSVVATHCAKAPSILMVIFSKDRPLQLDACLKSITQHTAGLTHLAILYLASDAAYQAGYDYLATQYSRVTFVPESHIKGGFKPALQQICHTYNPEYIIFGVDDNIVMRPINLITQARLLESCKAYGYYNRLGENITHCYAMHRKVKVPHLTPTHNAHYIFNVSDAECDWNYPNTVDMTLYRWSDVQPFVDNSSYYNPNTFEGHWACNTQAIHKYQSRALCPRISTITNLPMNRVQNTYNNRSENSYSPAELLELYTQGYRINLQELYCHTFDAPHSAYTPHFIAH